MKTVLTFLALGLFYLSSAQVDKFATAKLISTEIQSNNGSFSANLVVYAHDTVTIIDAVSDSFPVNWTVSTYPLANTMILPGDSVLIPLSVQYDVNNIPYYPSDVMFKIKCSSFDTIIIPVFSKIYFTPYNTIEVWNISDFVNLKRLWHTSDMNYTTTRQYIDQNDIPTSNIQPVYWDSLFGSIEYENNDNFRELTMPGLAYSVLMQPIPNDSLLYYSHFGDGPDSAYVDSNKTVFTRTFTGTISGRLVFNSVSDLNGSNVVRSLRGIKIIIEDRDLFGTYYENIAVGYTNEDGYFTINYVTEQFNEGSNMELRLKVVSESDVPYNIRCTKSLGMRYFNIHDLGDAPQTYYNDIGTKYIISEVEAFSSVCYARNASKYFVDNNLTSIVNLTVKAYASANNSYAFPPEFNFFQNEFTLHLEPGDGNDEGTVYHEFGHFVMWRLQGDDMEIAYSYDCFSHNGTSENTSHIDWSEGWANFISFIIDAHYYQDDGEYGIYTSFDSRIPIAEQVRISMPIFAFKGLRIEILISQALYDLWDGPQKGLPSQIPYLYPSEFDYYVHGYNDINSNFSSQPEFVDDYISPNWRTVDDVEFSILEICQPLIDHSIGIETVQDYFTALMDQYDNDCKKRSDISRVFKENYIVWRADEYYDNEEYGNMSSDFIKLNKQYDETAFCIFFSPTWSDIYGINNLNNSSWNEIDYWGVNIGNANISEPHLIGNLTKGYITHLNFNPQDNLGTINPNPVDVYELCETGQLVVRNGAINLGGPATSANLIVNDKCLIHICQSQSLTLRNDSKIIVENGGTLYIEKNSFVTFWDNSQIIVKPGGYICIEEGANIDGYYGFDLQSGYIVGTNPVLNIQHLEPCGTIACNTFVLFDFPNDLIIDYDSHIQYRTNNFNSNIIVTNNSTLELDNCVYAYPLLYHKASKFINSALVVFTTNARIIALLRTPIDNYYKYTS